MIVFVRLPLLPTFRKTFETFRLRLALVALRRESFALKPRDLGNDRGYRLDRMNLARVNAGRSKPRPYKI